MSLCWRESNSEIVVVLIHISHLYFITVGDIFLSSVQFHAFIVFSQLHIHCVGHMLMHVECLNYLPKNLLPTHMFNSTNWILEALWISFWKKKKEIIPIINVNLWVFWSIFFVLKVSLNFEQGLYQTLNKWKHEFNSHYKKLI